MTFHDFSILFPLIPVMQTIDPTSSGDIVGPDQIQQPALSIPQWLTQV